MRVVRASAAWLREHPSGVDAVIAGALAAASVAGAMEHADYLTGSTWVYVVAGLLMTVPLAWRRRAPLVVVVVVMGALIVESLVVGKTDSVPDVQIVPWLLAVYSVAAHGTGRAPVAGGIFSLAAGLVWMGPDDFLLPTVLIGGAWLAGRLVKKREVYARALEHEAEVSERAGRRTAHRARRGARPYRARAPAWWDTTSA
jgi:hypothetical protein